MGFFKEDFTEVAKENDGYMKLMDGENRIRILSSVLQGYETWENNKPIRFRISEKPMPSVDPTKKVREFWSFICWNYALSRIQILNVTQEGIKKTIKALVSDIDWGCPVNFDLKIVREGKEINTKYSVSPCPHKPISKEIIDAFNDKPINLEALYDNGDPFSEGYLEYTKVLVSSEDIKVPAPIAVPPKLSPVPTPATSQQISQLEGLIALCQPGYRDSIVKRINDKFHMNDLCEITSPMFNALLIEASKKVEEYAEFKRKEAQLEFENSDLGF